MNKKLIYIGLIVLVAAAFYLFFIKSSPAGAKAEKDAPVAIAKNSPEFDASFNKLLTAYFQLKNALVASDTAKANAGADLLHIAADSLKVNEIQGDSTGAIKTIALDFAATVSASAKGLLGETSIEEKRKEFELITDALWNLTRTVKFTGRKIYYQFCPMALNDKGAFWMSEVAEINNPYFGEEMLHCGSTEDSLDYSGK